MSSARPHIKAVRQHLTFPRMRIARRLRRMAIWQFVLDLIPAAAARIDGIIAARMSSEQLSGIELRFSQSKANSFFERVGMMLPGGRFRGSEYREWGDDAADDVQIHLEDAAIQYVQVRLNVADIRMPLVDGICALARDFSCVFATRGGAIIRPQRELVLRAILRSDAARFVSDPDRFIRELTAAKPETGST
jgi:hypothetical protein